MSRGRAILAIVIILIIGGIIGGALMPPADDDSSQSDPEGLVAQEPVYHVTLASPEAYTGEMYSSTFTVPEDAGGQYVFDFVPNGSSPALLSITLKSDNDTIYSEDFSLVGTKHEAGFGGEYYTWEYQGNDVAIIPGDTEILIEIDPNGNTQGSVSVYLFEY